MAIPVTMEAWKTCRTAVLNNYEREKMRLQDFIKLPPKHTNSFENGQKLDKDIALRGSAGLSKEQSDRLRTYLEICLLHQKLDPNP